MVAILRFFTIRSVRYATLNYPFIPTDVLRLDPDADPPLPYIEPETGRLGRINIASLCSSHLSRAPYLPWVAAPVDSLYVAKSPCEFNGMFAPVFPIKWLVSTRTGLVPSVEAWKMLSKALEVALFAADQVVDVAKLESIELPAFAPPRPSSSRPGPFPSSDHASAWLRLVAAQVRILIAFVHWFLDSYPNTTLPRSTLPSSSFYSVPTDTSSYKNKLGCVIDFGTTAASQWAALDRIKELEKYKVPYIFPVPENLLDNAAFDRFRPAPLREPTPPPRPVPPPPHRLPPMTYIKVEYDRGKKMEMKLSKADGRRMEREEGYYSRVDRKFNICYISDLPLSGQEADSDDDFGPYKIIVDQDSHQRVGPRPDSPPFSDAARTPVVSPLASPILPTFDSSAPSLDRVPSPLRPASPMQEDTETSSANELRAVPHSYRPKYVPPSTSRALEEQAPRSTEPMPTPRGETTASSSYRRETDVRRRTDVPRRNYLTKSSGNSSSSSGSNRDLAPPPSLYPRTRRGRSPPRHRERRSDYHPRYQGSSYRPEPSSWSRPPTHSSGWGQAVAAHGWDVPKESSSTDWPQTRVPTPPVPTSPLPQGDGGWAGMFARSQVLAPFTPRNQAGSSSASLSSELNPPPRVAVPPLLYPRTSVPATEPPPLSLASRLATPRVPSLAERLAPVVNNGPSLLNRLDDTHTSPPLSPLPSNVNVAAPVIPPPNVNVVAPEPVATAADVSPQVYRRRAFISLFWDVLPSPGVPAVLTAPGRLLAVAMLMRRRFLEVAPSFASLSDAVLWLVEARVPFRLYIQRDLVVAPPMPTAPNLPDYFRFDPEPYLVMPRFGSRTVPNRV
ncbi:hypothetical protein SISNIDRAFT_484266 [Sistotremastrum niveocremeum HHB9708]|uniref:Uncharacterized protein n=1 Tax=Sistotremastrum niveocremeum HHB9708 TaxID=1314777 RepID=A0A164W4H8_9AGAM|nr:hypothetical protein SISNIDRAFT_484266 [Sistotremastrum niveocremeum HHB9708]